MAARDGADSRRETTLPADDLSGDDGDEGRFSDEDVVEQQDQSNLSLVPRSDDVLGEHQEDADIRSLVQEFSGLTGPQAEGVHQLVERIQALHIPPGASSPVLNVVGTLNIYTDTEDFVFPETRIGEAERIFVKTRGYSEVKDALEYNGHVLVTGSPGSGKTTMAYYIMSRYEKKHYKVVFIEFDNLSKFRFDKHVKPGQPTMLVFDDMFGDFSLTPERLVVCKRVLKDLKSHFSRLDAKRRKKREEISDDDDRKELLKVIMTSRTSVLEMAKNKLREYKSSMLRSSSVIDLTTFLRLSEEEKEKILKKHLKKGMRTLNPDTIRLISSHTYDYFGFPHLCELFVDSICSEENALAFFKEPISHIVGLVSEIFEREETKGRACVLLLMVLNDGELNLADLQSVERKRESGLTNKLDKCKELLGDISELEPKLSVIAKQDIKTFLESNKDDVMFNHPTMHDAVAFVVGDMNQIFVLENCSLRFIVERTKVLESLSPSGGNFENFVIELSEDTAKVLIERLAREIKDCNFALPLSHSCFSSKDMVDFLFQELSRLGSKDACLHSNDNDYELGFLFWASFISEGRMCETALENTTFRLSEITEGCFGCCMSGNAVVLTMLLSNSLSDTTKDITSKALGEILRTPLASKSYYRALSTAASPTKADAPEMPETPRMHGDERDQLIHIAAANGFPDVVEVLLQYGADIDAKGGNEMTALMYACYLGHTYLVRMLLTYGANPCLLDEEGDNCLHLACRGGSVDILKMLHERHMDLNTRGEHERSPLMYAAYNGHEDVVTFLLENGAIAQPDLTSFKNKDNCLHLACIKGHTKVVTLLITKGEMSLEERGGNYRTPIMYAVRHGELDTARELQERGANIRVTDEIGLTCLHLVAMSGDVPTAEWVLCELKPQNAGDEGRSPLMFALQRGNIEMVHYLCEQGASLMHKDDGDTSCINFAAKSGCTELVDLCIDAGLDVNTVNATGLTPAVEACRHGRLLMLHYLITKGADVLR